MPQPNMTLTVINVKTCSSDMQKAMVGGGGQLQQEITRVLNNIYTNIHIHVEAKQQLVNIYIQCTTRTKVIMLMHPS